MASFEPLTGSRIPDQSDGPLGGLQISNSIRDIADNTHPRFANNSERDSKFAAWAAVPGNAMVDGLHCTVAGFDQIYRAGQWRGTAPQTQSTSAIVDITTHLSSLALMTLAVADP